MMASDDSCFPSALLLHVSDSEADDDRPNPLGVVVAPSSSDEEGGGLPTSNKGGVLTAAAPPSTPGFSGNADAEQDAELVEEQDRVGQLWTAWWSVKAGHKFVWSPEDQSKLPTYEPPPTCEQYQATYDSLIKAAIISSKHHGGTSIEVLLRFARAKRAGFSVAEFRAALKRAGDSPCIVRTANRTFILACPGTGPSSTPSSGAHGPTAAAATTGVIQGDEIIAQQAARIAELEARIVGLGARNVGPGTAAAAPSPTRAIPAATAVPHAEPARIGIGVCREPGERPELVYVLHTASGTVVVPTPAAFHSACARARGAGFIVRTTGGNYKLGTAGVLALPPSVPPPPPLLCSGVAAPSTPPQRVRPHTAMTGARPQAAHPGWALSWYVPGNGKSCGKKAGGSWPCIAFGSKGEAEGRLCVKLGVPDACPSDHALLFFLGSLNCAYASRGKVCALVSLCAPTALSRGSEIAGAVSTAGELLRLPLGGMPCLICAHQCPREEDLLAHVRSTHAESFTVL